MPRLIHLNGQPAIGKSTLAARYVEHHSGVLNLDLDRLRPLVGGWREDFGGTGEVVRRLALSMAATHLRAGHDVVIPQYVGRLDQLQRFEQAASDSGADFIEVVLLDSVVAAVQRFAARPAGTGPQAQVRRVIAAAGGEAELRRMYDGIVDVLRARPSAHVITSVNGAVDETYAALLKALG